MTSDKPKTHEEAVTAFDDSLQELEDFKNDLNKEPAENLDHLDESAQRLAKAAKGANKEKVIRSSDDAIESYDPIEQDSLDDDESAEPVYDEEDENEFDKFSNKVGQLESEKREAYLSDIEYKYQEAYNRLNSQENELFELRNKEQEREDKEIIAREADLKYALKLARRDEDEDASIRIEDALMDVKAQKHMRLMLRAQQGISQPQTQQFAPQYQPPQQMTYAQPGQQLQHPYLPYAAQPQYRSAQDRPKERPRVAAPRSQSPTRRAPEAAPKVDRRVTEMLENMSMKNPDGSTKTLKEKQDFYVKYGDR